MTPPRVFRFRALTTGVAVVLAAVVGVSCQGDGRRPVFPVRGQVLFENKPTPGALVIFHPVNDPDPRAPRPLARVAANGSFALTTYGNEDGAPAGEYAVTVAWVKEVDNQTAPVEERREPKNLVPERYGKPETSGLRVHIKEAANDLKPFQLTKR